MKKKDFVWEEKTGNITEDNKMSKDEINTENNNEGLSDLEEFEKPGKMKYLIIAIVLLAVVTAAYFLFYSKVKNNLPKVSIASGILEDKEVSKQSKFRLKDSIYIYVDYQKPLKQNKVEIQFFKIGKNKKAVYKGKQEKEIFNPNIRRRSFYIAPREFERWGAGKYKLIVMSSSGEALVTKEFYLK